MPAPSAFDKVKPFLLPLGAALLLLAGTWRLGLLDPWEMNRTHVAQVVAGGTRVVSVGVPQGSPGEAFRAAVADCCVAYDYADDEPSTLEAALTRPLADLRGTLAHVFVIFPDDVLGADEGADTLAKRIERLTVENPGLAVIVATDKHHVDDEAFRSVGASDVVAVADAGAAVARHASDSWWRVQFRKAGQTLSLPVLEPWLTAASFRLFGENELAARLPSLLLGLCLVLAVMGLARRVGGTERTATVSGFVLLTLPVFLLGTRTVADGVAFPLFLTLAAWPLVGSADRSPRARDVALFVAALVGGFLSRGLSFVLIAALGALAWTLVGRVPRRQTLVYVGVAAGLLGLGVALVFVPDGFTFFDHFRFMARPFLGGPIMNDRNFDFFVNRSGFALGPWAALLPFALGAAVLGTGDPARAPRDLALGVFALVVYLSLSAMLPYFGHASYALYPLLAVVLGRYVEEVLDDPALRGRFVAFLGFSIIAILAIQVRESPLAVLNSVLLDPPLARELGDYKLPPDLKVGTAVPLAWLMFGLVLAWVFARGWTRGQRFLEMFRSPRHAGLLLGGLALLILADGFASGLLRINSTVMSSQAAQLPSDARRWPFFVFGARYEAILGYAALGALVLAGVVTWIRGRRREAQAPTAGTYGVRHERILLAAAAILLSLGAVYAAVLAGAPALATIGRSPAFVVWLVALTALGLARLRGPEHVFGADGAFPWLGPLATPLAHRRALAALRLLGLAYLGVAFSRVANASPIALWATATPALALVLWCVLPWATSAAWRFAATLMSVLVVFGLLFVPYVVETWLWFSGVLYPEIQDPYAHRVFLEASDVRFLWLLVGAATWNALWPRRSALSAALQRKGVLLGAAAVLGAVLVVSALLASNVLVAYDAAFSRSLSRVLIGASALVAVGLLVGVYPRLAAFAGATLRHPLTLTLTLAGASLAGVVALAADLPPVLFAALGLAVVALSSWLLSGRSLADVPGALETPSVALPVLALLALVGAVGTGHDLLGRVVAQFSQKHILDTYLAVEEREAIGPNIFKHGSFSKTDQEDTNFYTNTVPEVRDRAKVLALLDPVEDVPVRLAWSSRGEHADAMVLPGWNPANDRNNDGQRDAIAAAGLATAGTEGRLEDETAAWKPDQWKGATLIDSGKKSYPVTGNDASSLTLTGTPNFLAYNPLFNAYSLDAGADLDHRATALTEPTYYFIFPKGSFADLNHAFRKEHRGRFIPIVDDRSDFFLLAASRLPVGRDDKNWLRQAVVTEDELKSDPRIKRCYAKFQDFIELVGFRMGNESVTRGSSAEINLYFRVLGETSTSWRLFMHVDRPGSQNRINGDHWPHNLVKETETNNKCEGCFKTTQWMKGDVVIDRFTLEVPIGTPSGTQEVWVGLYNPTDGNRLKVVDNDKKLTAHDGGNRVKAGTFIVP